MRTDRFACARRVAARWGGLNSVCEGVPDGAAALPRAQISRLASDPLPRVRAFRTSLRSVDIHERMIYVARLAGAPLGPTARVADSAPSTAPEFRAADASADASAAARRLGLRTEDEYLAHVRAHPGDRLPARPDRYYRERWGGWASFLSGDAR